ncbi:MAG: arginase family protein, partial [Bacillota bacterium]|nr:arginase family protein [Bacillota bacterium]
ETLKELEGKPVYLTVDLDVLDPSEFCGTGTPEAGGIKFKELEQVLPFLEDVNIVGFDINELAPVYDPSGVSTAVACKILRELLLAIYK